MSDSEKGAIMQQIQNLPRELQNQVESFVHGMAAGIACVTPQVVNPTPKEEQDAKKDG